MDDNTPSTDSTRSGDMEDPFPGVSETSRLSLNRPSGRGLPSNTSPSGNNFNAVSSGRVEANTALLKISQVRPAVPGYEAESDQSSGQDADSMQPDEEDEGSEAASARIAQEYRRQVRIKRLAEEIQTAEREKKQEEKNRRRSEMPQSQTNSGKKLATTAKVPTSVGPDSIPAPETEHAQKRAAAMSAFRQATVGGSGTGRKLLIAAASLLIVAGLAFGGYVLYNRMLADKDSAKTAEILALAQAEAAREAKAAQELKALEARELEVLRQRKIAEEAAKEAAKKLEEQKREFEESQRTREAERLKQLEAEAARRLADERRMKEENEKLVEKANREKEELRKQVEDAQRVAQEKLRKKQEEEDAKALAEKNKSTEKEKADPVKPPANPDVAKVDVTKPPVAKVDPPKAIDPITGAVKTIPAEAPTIPDRLDLPSGGVRLYVKASDPYGGKLLFTWKQIKGTQVEIADPTASKFVDGKWVSQTYFVAREPGGYEFEVIVKNDDGVETKKKFPIEVLPPTTLK